MEKEPTGGSVNAGMAECANLEQWLAGQYGLHPAYTPGMPAFANVQAIMHHMESEMERQDERLDKQKRWIGKIIAFHRAKATEKEPGASRLHAGVSPAVHARTFVVSAKPSGGTVAFLRHLFLGH